MVTEGMNPWAHLRSTVEHYVSAMTGPVKE
jgi:hypothetical protein